MAKFELDPDWRERLNQGLSNIDIEDKFKEMLKNFVEAWPKMFDDFEPDSEYQMMVTDYADLEPRVLAMHQSIEDYDLAEEFDRLVQESNTRVNVPAIAGAEVQHNGHNAKVISPLENGEVRIKFDNPDLIPPIMDVAPRYLEGRAGDTAKKFVNPHQNCPHCDVAWERTESFRFIYWDCPKCEAKKEEYVNEKNTI